jgi:putative flavoprotein involved in K+ transport
MDDYAQKNGMLPSKDTTTQAPVPHLPLSSESITELDPRNAGITSVVWCSGFRYDFGWVNLPILNDAGEPPACARCDAISRTLLPGFEAHICS